MGKTKRGKAAAVAAALESSSDDEEVVSKEMGTPFEQSESPKGSQEMLKAFSPDDSSVLSVGGMGSGWAADTSHAELTLGPVVHFDGGIVLQITDVLLYQKDDPEKTTVSRKFQVKKKYYSKKKGADDFITIDIPIACIRSLASAVTQYADMVAKCEKPTTEEFLAKEKKAAAAAAKRRKTC